MCFQLRPANYKGQNVKIAKKDIVCYKEVSITSDDKGKLKLKSYIQGSPYTLGRIKSSKFDIRSTEIYRGLHSYRRNYYNANVKCIIPRGAAYYINKSEYCSNKIKIVEILPEAVKQIKHNYGVEITILENKVASLQKNISVMKKFLSKL